MSDDENLAQPTKVSVDIKNVEDVLKSDLTRPKEWSCKSDYEVVRKIYKTLLAYRKKQYSWAEISERLEQVGIKIGPSQLSTYVSRVAASKSKKSKKPDKPIETKPEPVRKPFVPVTLKPADANNTQTEPKFTISNHEKRKKIKA